MPTVDIVLSVYNGQQYIGEQIRSIQAQTHEEWRLWIRDDGSTDGTHTVIEELAAADTRIRLHSPDGKQLGVSLAFSWLLERLPEDAQYVACSDADDVWLPDKIARTHRALCQAEKEDPGPILVHTDMRVVDSELDTISPSLWRHLGIEPEPTKLERLIVQNVVTGPTILMNRDLLARVVPIPAEVTNHDWWIALVAAGVGRIVTLSDTTVLYRRHSGNHTAASHAGKVRLGRIVAESWKVLGRTSQLRWWLAATGRHAELCHARFGSELPPMVSRFLQEYAEIPRLGFLRRKLRVLRLRALPEHGMARNVALLLRA